MTPDERDKLLELIDGHHAAMRAQVVEPGVRLECLTAFDKWDPNPHSILFAGDLGPNQRLWHRLAPVPRMVPLDQSDFLGPNRVTHLRRSQYTDDIKLVLSVRHGFVLAYGLHWMGFNELSEFECSRDGGATFGPCCKPDKETKS